MTKNAHQTGILIQSRLSSTRLPGKMLMDFNGVPLVEYVYKRCMTSREAAIVAVITSDDPSDDPLYDFCLESRIPVFRGDLNDVLNRTAAAARHYELSFVCRVCGDSPFVDIATLDHMLLQLSPKALDYISLTHVVDGFLAEVFRSDCLYAINATASSAYDREHVTPSFRKADTPYRTDFIDMKMDSLATLISITVDTADDYAFCLKIAQGLAKRKASPSFYFTRDDVLNVIYELMPHIGALHHFPQKT